MKISWYTPENCPPSPVGYVYVIKLLKPYFAGWRSVIIGGYYVTIRSCPHCPPHKKLIGGVRLRKPQWVGRYLGWCARSVAARFAQHVAGQGARLMAHLANIGWPMEIEACTPGGRDLEAQLKRLHSNQRIVCPEQLRLFLAATA